MDLKSKIIEIWGMKRVRNIIILIILSIVFVSIIVYRVLNMEKPPPQGAKRVVVCKNCKKTDIKRIYKIKEEICDYCNKKGTLAFAWKCEKCKYEYHIVKHKFDPSKLNTMQRFQKVEESRSCPNCGETRDISPMSIQQFKR